MRRALALLSLLPLALACTQLDEPVSASPSDAASTPTQASAAQATSTTAASATLSARVREVAASAPAVEKIKLRFDADGALVKQSVYHDDAEAIPAPVRARASETYPGHTVTGYETEHYADLGEVFEVELDTAEGQHCEVAASEDGGLIYTECNVDPSSLPAAVADAIRNTLAGAKILEAELETRDEQRRYSIELELDGREYYLRVADDGTVLSRHVLVPAVVEIPLP